MEVVIEQGILQNSRITYQAEVPYSIKCRKCKNDYVILLMQVHDDKGDLIIQRLDGHKVWPHDASVINIYLCTNCGAMRADWNQG